MSQSVLEHEAESDWVRLEIWNEWKAATRLLHCVQIAHHREATELGRTMGVSTVLKDPTGATKFSVRAAEYIGTLGDEDLVCGMVLVQSQALVEAHIRAVLLELVERGAIEPESLTHAPFWKEPRESPADAVRGLVRLGIETWGPFAMSLVDGRWDVVAGGMPLLVEAAVARNAVAHGARRFTVSMRNRILGANGTPRWSIGDEIRINIPILREYRIALQTLARTTSFKIASLRRMERTDYSRPRRSGGTVGVSAQELWTAARADVPMDSRLRRLPTVTWKAAPRLSTALAGAALPGLRGQPLPTAPTMSKGRQATSTPSRPRDDQLAVEDLDDDLDHLVPPQQHEHVSIDDQRRTLPRRRQPLPLCKVCRPSVPTGVDTPLQFLASTHDRLFRSAHQKSRLILCRSVSQAQGRGFESRRPLHSKPPMFLWFEQSGSVADGTKLQTQYERSM
jgi:hypothetical protein